MEWSKLKNVILLMLVLVNVNNDPTWLFALTVVKAVITALIGMVARKKAE